MPKPPGRLLRSPLLLRLLIEKKGQSCNTVAAQIDRSRQYVAFLANGTRPTCSPETADHLAIALDVDVDDLFWPLSSDESSEGRNT